MVYPSYLKNREFDEKASQNSCLERVTIAREQGTSEEKNFVKKQAQSKTDSSGSLGKSPNSTTPTSRSLKQLLPSVLSQITKQQKEHSGLILLEWQSLIGERLAPMTKAVSFMDGILSVKVRNSSLLSLLSQHERPKLLKQLRNKFPHVTIRNIRFYIG